MNNLQNKSSVSLVNIILPKDSLNEVSQNLINAGAKGIFQVTARGSVINEGGFFTKMFPPPAPEQCLVQVLVPKRTNGITIRCLLPHIALRAPHSKGLFHQFFTHS